MTIIRKEDDNMSNDWKQQYEENKRRKEEDERRKREALLEEQQQKEREKRQAEEQRLAQEYEERMIRHKQMFKCHICGKSSEGPYKDIPSPTAWYWPSDSEMKFVWNQPTGLLKCARCGRWTCFDDEADGKCRRCLGY
jgi:hypothetical protein